MGPPFKMRITESFYRMFGTYVLSGGPLKKRLKNLQCTLPRTFTYRAYPFSVHCLSFKALAS